MRKILHLAVAAGTWSARHRIIAALAVFAILVASVGGGILTVRALAPGQTFPGDMAIGAHTFRADPKAMTQAEIETAFCSVCHEQVHTDLGAGHNGQTCLDCHANASHTGTGDALCTDCHGNRDDLTGDVHESMLADVSETFDAAAWTCMACHTELEIAMTTTAMSPPAFTLP